MKPKAEKTLADFIVIAISPVLIMALVGSLVFFLAEVLYVGQYQGRLLWILFFFVFGSVLVARISIEYDAGRATLYGSILGIAAWVGMACYVEYPAGSQAAQAAGAINLGLIGIIWWSAHRLTWDCTMIDDAQDASGAGLMQAAGLDQDADAAGKPKKDKKAKRSKRKDAGLAAWWRRYQRFREERANRPMAPGVWVVYFSLAALPLYGLGQALIPLVDEERRRYVFWLMSIYVASGLGLLLTTSFLGLRRYLRQKKLQMPAAMAGVWLMLGAVLIAVFLTLGALLPRPAAEYALIDLPWRAASKERDASRFAVRGDEAGKDEGRPSAKDKAKNGEGKDAKGKADGASAVKKDKGTDAKDKDRGGEKGQAKDKQAKAEPQDAKAAPEQRAAPPLEMPEWTSKVATILKWIVLGAFGLLVAFFLVRALLMFLANFTGWAKSLLDFFRNWWQGFTANADAKAGASDASAGSAAPRPFSAFHDPFQSGEADGMSSAELVRYTFEAVQSWASERDEPREAGETPLEFAERLGEEAPKMADALQHLAQSYAGVAYAQDTPTDECRDPLRELWQMLEEAKPRDGRPWAFGQ